MGVLWQYAEGNGRMVDLYTDRAGIFMVAPRAKESAQQRQEAKPVATRILSQPPNNEPELLETSPNPTWRNIGEVDRVWRSGFGVAQFPRVVFGCLGGGIEATQFCFLPTGAAGDKKPL